MAVENNNSASALVHYVKEPSFKSTESIKQVKCKKFSIYCNSKKQTWSELGIIKFI